MLRVIVESAEVREKTGVSTRTQKPYRIREQGAYVFILGEDGKEKKFPSQLKISLEDNQPPYAPGEYRLSLSSLYVGRYDALQVGRLHLVPAAQVAQSRVA